MRQRSNLQAVRWWCAAFFLLALTAKGTSSVAASGLSASTFCRKNTLKIGGFAPTLGRMNLARLLNPFPVVFRQRKLAKLLLERYPQARIQLVRFNGSAKLFADVSQPIPRTTFLEKSFDPFFFELAKLF